MFQSVLTNLTLVACLAGTMTAAGEEPKSQLGKVGQELLSEKFDRSELVKNWKRNTGKLELSQGSLRLSELAADKHIGAFRYPLAIKDMVVKLDFQFDGAKAFHLGFDPAPGELDKKGHLYNVIITPTKWSLVENNDKAKPDSKPKAHAQGQLKLEQHKWYTLTLENRGEEVVATIEGLGKLQAKASDFKVKKPALVFRAAGEDNTAVLVDNLSVHELN